MLKDPAFSNLYFDISWAEVAKYLVSSPEALKISSDLINQFPDRFLFGTDEVAPTNQKDYLGTYFLYGPLWKLLTPDTSEKVRKGNYERLFNRARIRVRAWEAIHFRAQELKTPIPQEYGRAPQMNSRNASRRTDVP
jgi:hypothetical protein